MDCGQSVLWNNNLSMATDRSTVLYRYIDADDFAPEIDQSVFHTPNEVITIARVPEPSGLGLAIWTVLVGAVGGRRRKHMRQ